MRWFNSVIISLVLMCTVDAGPEERHPPRPEQVIKQADLNDDGLLDLAEFRQLKKVKELSDEVAEKLFNRFDKNEDGVVDLHELRVEKPERGSPRELIHMVFKRWDQDGDEHLNAEEYAQIGLRFKNTVFEEVDQDADGLVSLRELVMARPAKPRSERPRGPEDGPKHGGPRLLAEIDADQDQMITRSELAQGERYKRLAAVVERLSESFEDIDTDEDHQLSFEELRRFSKSQVRERRKIGSREGQNLEGGKSRPSKDSL